ncbi:serine threonine kinase protein [Rutstroemia sp. NJR-2017a WRK4]|nr:serine threonine kinase protein [Rutstroemia sp. NJR-2017a WRK4]
MDTDIDSQRTPSLPATWPPRDIDIDSRRLSCLPPNGIKPVDEYSAYRVRVCRTEDKKSLIIYPSLYRPRNDPFYEDPDGSCHAWQNQEDSMDQIEWLKKIHEVIGSSEPTTHPRVQRLVEIQTEDGLPVVEFVEKGALSDFLRANPKPVVPSGKGSENLLTLNIFKKYRGLTTGRLRWALNIASALAFLHTKNIIFEGLSPDNINLRPDLSAALVNLDVAGYREQSGSDGTADGYGSPDWHGSPLSDEPETWIKPSQDIYAFGSLLYYLWMEDEPWAEEYNLMDDLEENDLDEIIRKCWVNEFGSMDEVVEAVKKLVAQEGLEMSGEDDIAVGASVEQFEAAGCFAERCRIEDANK